MNDILERIGKKRECPNCSYDLKYSWLSLINKEWVAFYSKAGDAVLVSEKLKKLSTTEDFLEESISNYEKSCDFDKPHGFSLRNELKCPNCDYSLTSRSTEVFENIVNSRLIFLDGMVFINDEKTYKIKINIE